MVFPPSRWWLPNKGDVSGGGTPLLAVYYEEFQQPLKVGRLADPEPAPDGVVIAVRSTGLCRSDWHGWMGHDSDIRLPHVPGHEFAGVIVDVGPEVNNWRIGDRVTVPFAVGCGQCSPCREGDLQICDDYFQPGFTAWGSFAELVAIPHADLNLVRLPEVISFEAAASLGCRMVTSFRAIVDQGKLKAEQSLAVFGCGGVGLAAVLIGKAMGARVIGVDVNPESLELARQLGASDVIMATDSDPVAAIHDLTGGGAHLSLDALGNPVVCQQAIASLKKRGRHVQVGLISDGSVSVPMDQVIARELEIVGSHGMAAADYAPLLQLIIDGKLDPQRLVTRGARLEDVPGLLPDMALNQHQGITVVNISDDP